MNWTFKPKDRTEILTRLYQVTLFMFVVGAIVAAWTTIPVFGGMESGKAIYIGSLMLFLFYADQMTATHHNLIRRDVTINHGMFALIRVIAAIGLSFAFNYTSAFGYVKGIYLSISLLFAFSFWFDIKLNSLRRLPFDYTGKLAWYDRLLGRENWKIDLVIVVIALLML